MRMFHRFAKQQHKPQYFNSFWLYGRVSADAGLIQEAVVKCSYHVLYLSENLKENGCAFVTIQHSLEKLGLGKY